MVNIKKISTRLYLLLNAVIYFGMIMLNEFVINTFGLTYKLILTIVFAAMIFLHFAFFQIHYNDFLTILSLRMYCWRFCLFLCRYY